MTVKLESLWNAGLTIPHGYCLSWKPSLLWTFVTADTVIAVSYFSIPFGIAYFISKRKDIPHRNLAVLFSIFIVACGITHILDILNIWSPDYLLNAIARVITGIASILTAISLWLIMPKLLKAPSTQQLTLLKNQLEESHKKLEDRVQERTKELVDYVAENMRFRNALDQISAFVYMKDKNFKYVYGNQLTLDLFKCSAETLKGKDDNEFFSSETVKQLRVNDQRVIELGENISGEVHSSDANGNNKFYWEIKTPIYLDVDSKEIWGLCGISRDITEQKKIEELIWRQANYDELTGLPNRNMIAIQFNQKVEFCQKNKCMLAVMFVDLDHFKEVNDTFGHEAGDLLIQEAATRINSCIRKIDIVGRFGGDEFIVLLHQLQFDEKELINRTANRIIETLKLPFKLNQDVAYISASIGITFFPEDGDSFSALLKNADQAMYTAKRQGRSGFYYYTPIMAQQAHQRMQLINDLHTAIEENQLEVYYQPIFDLKTGNIQKAEALIRWNHPKLGLIMPSNFISLAEETGLIISIGSWVFEQACAQIAYWNSKHGLNLQISINKSPVQFKANIENHLIQIQDTLNHYSLHGDNVIFEITESVMMEAKKEILDQLIFFRDFGIQVALDDFGTGYSSLSYLQQFDIDYIKIDKSFISRLTPNSNNLVLCEAMIMMAHKLNMKVIAEGVETKEQNDLLSIAGCDQVQGYLYSKPITAKSFEHLLTSSSP